MKGWNRAVRDFRFEPLIGRIGGTGLFRAKPVLERGGWRICRIRKDGGRGDTATGVYETSGMYVMSERVVGETR